jgi:LAO/AO transport system kinase
MMEMLSFPGWVPELVMTQALSGDGIDALWAAIERHVAYLHASGAIAEKRRETFLHQVRQLALGRLQRRLDAALRREPASGIDPYAAADRVLAAFGGRGAGDGEDAAGEAAPTAARPRATVKGLR